MAFVETASPPRLIDDMMPVGVWLFREMATRAEQEEMRDELRHVARAAPFVTPQMPDGVPFKLK